MSNSRCNHPKKNNLFWIAAAMIFAVFGSYYLWMQHRAHVLQYWPLVLFLLCPLMHLFGGRCHHGGSREHGQNGSKKGEA